MKFLATPGAASDGGAIAEALAYSWPLAPHGCRCPLYL